MPKRDSHQSTSTSRTSASGRGSKRRSPSEQVGGGNSVRSSRSRASATSSHASPNFDSSDPYAILGVPRDATFQQIKLSYRKMALKHHPDRQASESDKKVAHKNFAAIGGAYEILGDEERRRNYDEGIQQQRHQQQQQQQQQRQQGRGQHRGSSSRGFDDNAGSFGHDPLFSMFNDPFFSSSFGGGMSHGNSGRSSRSSFHFMDPFDLFEQVFAEEMGHHHRQHNSHSSGRMDPFSSDPFFSSGDPFSSSRGSMFGGGGMNQMMTGMMSGHFNMMNSMMSQTQGGFGGFHQELMTGGGGGNGGGSSYNFMSSSTSSARQGGHQSVSTSTRTTIVNGVRKTIRERTVVNPDGSVEKHVETIGGDGNNAGRISSGNRPALGCGGRRSTRR